MCEALKQKYQQKLGEDFGAVLYEVRNDWLTGLVRLKEYRQLFSDHDVLKLLNAAGGAFMWDVQQILWRDLLLHVTRLTDPATMGRHENLSVQALPRFCERAELQAEYPELQTEVQALVNKAVTAAEAPRDWRNRRISHTDRGLAIDPDAESLAPTSLRQVQAALDAVHAVIHTITWQTMKDETANDVMVQATGESVLGVPETASHGRAVRRRDHRPRGNREDNRCRFGAGLSQKGRPVPRLEGDATGHRATRGGAQVQVKLHGTGVVRLGDGPIN